MADKDDDTVLQWTGKTVPLPRQQYPHLYKAMDELLGSTEDGKNFVLPDLRACLSMIGRRIYHEQEEAD